MILKHERQIHAAFYGGMVLFYALSYFGCLGSGEVGFWIMVSLMITLLTACLIALYFDEPYVP